MVNQSHVVIIIPGLGNSYKSIKQLTRSWNKFGLETEIFQMNWYEPKESFQKQLNRLGDEITNLSKTGKYVSLIGISAGGSMAINAYINSKDKIHTLINICGRLRKGNHTGLRSFNTQTKSSKIFAESLEFCEKNIDSLLIKDRVNIMTIRALLGDELVPWDTTTLEGAKNIFIPTPEHVFSIIMALTVFSKSLITFIKGK